MSIIYFSIEFIKKSIESKLRLLKSYLKLKINTLLKRILLKTLQEEKLIENSEAKINSRKL